MRTICHSCVLAAAILFSSCDDGRIYPNQAELTNTGNTIKIECRLTGTEAWSSFPDYALSLAAFAGDGSEYALVSRNIASSSLSDSIITLTGVPAEAQTVEICILDRLRKRVVTLASADASLNVVTIPSLDVSPLSAAQQAVFTPTCSACHGGGHNAGGVSLATMADTRRTTVGIAANHPDEGASLRVAPGNPDASVLYRALTTDASASWAYDHSVEVVNPALRDIVGLWIKSEKGE